MIQDNVLFETIRVAKGHAVKREYDIAYDMLDELYTEYPEAFGQINDAIEFCAGIKEKKG